MKKLRKSLISQEKIEPKDGQRKLLRSSKDLIRCPSLVYQYTVFDGWINEAFDLLFEELVKNNKNNYGKK